MTILVRWPGLKKLLGFREPPITHCRFSVFPPDGAFRVYSVVQMSPQGERWVGRGASGKGLMQAYDALADTATRIRIALAKDERHVTLNVQEGPPFHLDLHVERPTEVGGTFLHTFDVHEHGPVIRWTYQDWPGVVQLELLADGDPYIEAPRRCDGNGGNCRLPKGHKNDLWRGYECLPCERRVVREGPAPALGGFRDSASPSDRAPESRELSALMAAVAALRLANERLEDERLERAPLVEALSDILTGNLEPRTLEGAMMRAKAALALTRKPLTKDPS